MKDGSSSRTRETAATLGLIIKESAAGFMRINGFDRAAALAFYAFLSLIPILFLEVLAVTHVARSSDAAIELLEAMTESATPVSVQFIVRELFALSMRRTWGLLTVVIMLWSATPLASGVRNAFYAIFRPGKPLPFWRGLLLDISAVMALLAVFGAGMIFKLALAGLVSSLPAGLALAVGWIYRGLAFLGLPLVFFVAYRIFVPVRLRFRHLATGSVLTSCLLWAVGPMFTWILKYNPNMGLVFGSLKTIFLLFVWVYYSAIAMLFGTETMANIVRRDVLVLGGLLSADRKHAPDILIERYAEAYAPGERIFSEDERDADAMYYVMDGSVILTRNGAQIAAIGKGQYFGEMAMLLNSARTMSAVAGEDGARLVVISRSNFEAILHEKPAAMLALLKEMADRLRRAETSSSPATDRPS